MQGSNLMSGKPGPIQLQTLRTRLEPALRWVFHLYWRFARGMTLGVRAVVLDGDDRVFLVKHSYVAGWHLPGGGVEVGETFRDALRRELAEEGRIEILGEPALHGLFLNRHVSRRDHVAVYLIRHFRQDRPPEPNREIVAAGGDDPGHPAADCGSARRQAAERDLALEQESGGPLRFRRSGAPGQRALCRRRKSGKIAASRRRWPCLPATGKSLSNAMTDMIRQKGPR
jgi:ADP-ribose pyrophosphatase YjhB (NUDIX family)